MHGLETVSTTGEFTGCPRATKEKGDRAPLARRELRYGNQSNETDISGTKVSNV